MAGSQNRSSSIRGRATALPSHTRGGSRMRESRTYGSVRGACDETHVPTATEARVHHAARRRGCVAARGAPEITIEQPMKIQRRKFLYLAAAGAVTSWLCRPASAQTYPSRSVRILVAYAPGGQTDTIARLLAQKLSDRFGTQFYVENV